MMPLIQAVVPKSVDVVIYGASGQARSIAEVLLRQSKFSDIRLRAFLDDFVESPAAGMDGIPIISYEDWKMHHARSRIILGMGDPRGKQHVAKQLLDDGAVFMEPVLTECVGLLSELRIGHGSYVGYGTYIGPDCVIGEHVSIMTNISMGHDVHIGDFTTICPTVTISGHVAIEEAVFLGAGAVILNGSARNPLRIGRGAKVAAGSVVTKSVPAGVTVMGNPARVLRQLAARR